VNLLTRSRIIILIVIIVLVLLVAIQNSYPVTIFFLFWRAQVDGVFLFLATFLVGLIAGAIAFWGWNRGRDT
jgi:uncharacterized integral membrane protein